MKTKTNKILLENTSVFDTSFENKNTVWRVTRLQSKICKRVTRLYLSKGKVTGLQEEKDYKSHFEGKGELSWTLVLNLEIWTWELNLKIGT